RTGFDRAGWIDIGYASGVIPSPTTRQIRFPYYASAGHTVTMREPDHLLADVMQWYASTPFTSAAAAAPPVAGAASQLSPSLSRSSAKSTSTPPAAVQFMGP
ncbi:MAG TPA: hypothetical protein VIM14_18745, partial [Polyangia bacterium]